jgi:GTP-binding protein
MKVRVRSATFAGVYPHNDAGLPQVAFAGRSNVGKSSLINALVNRKNLVHTSKTPGKTRSINLYRVETVELPPICLVDLPGYGFSRAPRSVTDSWEDALAAYLKDNPRLRLLVMLVDIRRDIGGYERMLSELMGTGPARIIIAATKADKLGFGLRTGRARELASQAGMPVTFTSARTLEGVDELWDGIAAALDTARGA